MNKMLTMLLLMGLTSQAMADMVKTSITSSANIRTKVESANLVDDADFYMALVTKLPKGTKIKFDSDDFVDKPLYKDGKGNIKRARALYYGPIKLIKVPKMSRKEVKKLNKKKLYVYRYSVDLTPIIKAKHDIRVPRGERKYKGKVEWDKISTKGYFSWAASKAMDELGDDLLSAELSDVKDYCPNYDNLDLTDRKTFWINLMSSIAKRESAFDPDVVNDESQFQANLNAISRGLLQISYSSSRSRRYRSRGCNARTASDLTDAKYHFECAVAIFSFLAEDGCISCKKDVVNKETGEVRKKSSGISRYWSTLREPYKLTCKQCSSGYVKVGKKDQITAETKKLKVCR